MYRGILILYIDLVWKLSRQIFPMHALDAPLRLTSCVSLRLRSQQYLLTVRVVVPASLDSYPVFIQFVVFFRHFTIREIFLRAGNKSTRTVLEYQDGTSSYFAPGTVVYRLLPLLLVLYSLSFNQEYQEYQEI